MKETEHCIGIEQLSLGRHWLEKPRSLLVSAIMARMTSVKPILFCYFPILPPFLTSI